MKKKCKECRNFEHKDKGIQTPAAFFCTAECVKNYAIRQGRRRTQKQQAAEKRERKEKLKDRKWWLKKAQQVFNAWIRERDKHLPCISCQRHHQGQYHAGHYRTTRASGQLRFDEQNVNKQCSACNNHLSGNIGEYRINLIKKIGLANVEALENSNDPKKWTVEELKEMVEKYKL